MEARRRPFLRSLEGIRAYAFLMVFAVHFSGYKWDLTHRSPWAYPWLIVLQLSFVAVPIFFALSGYLITGILFDGVDEPRYFSTFYLRRALRVFPLYYFVLALIVAEGLMLGYPLRLGHALYLVYLHNLSPDGTLRRFIGVQHLWSLAVEEQFYVLWPIAVWAMKTRRGLLTFSYAMVGVSFLLRLAAPLWHYQSFEVYEGTLFRCDAIMLGSALALHQRGPMQSLKRLTKPAWAVVLAGVSALVVRALTSGQALPYDRFGIVVIMPLLSLIGAATVLLAIQPGNVISYLCERPWAVFFGRMSYSLYLLHMLLVPVWEMKVIPFFSNLLGRGSGRAVALVLAFVTLSIASSITYKYIEVPGMRAKEWLTRDRSVSRHRPYGLFEFLNKVLS